MIGDDSDTLTAITGSLAEGFYGVPDPIRRHALSILDDGLRSSAKKVLTSMSRDEVINIIKTSNLKGRKGEGFPTWFKWNAAKGNPGKEKYIVCNADEGDPGAFMDRSVLEGDPHSLLEGMIIGGFAIGATEDIIYCRAGRPVYREDGKVFKGPGYFPPDVAEALGIGS